MTSKAIRELSASDAFWLKEIAYQFAVMNERNAEQAAQQTENRLLEFQAMIAMLSGTYIPQGPPYLPVTPGINSHTYHYTPDPETK